jgi:hypothetical protein
MCKRVLTSKEEDIYFSLVRAKNIDHNKNYAVRACELSSPVPPAAGRLKTPVRAATCLLNYLSCKAIK